MTRPWTSLTLAALLGAVAGCGGGDEDFEVTSGLYQLSTFEITGTCKLDNALAPGVPSVGLTMPVIVTTSAIAIDVRVCNHPDQDPSCGLAGDAFDFGMARDGNALIGSQLWNVPGCGMPNYTPTLAVAGNVTDVNALTVEWTATITSPEPQWMCSGYAPCSSTIRQRMAPIAGP